MSTFVVLGEASGEITEKKSRFIAVIKEIHSEQEALDFIESKRKQYWDARHNCYAYVLGANNEIQRFSDDKEPSGTAGKPILDVLLGANVRNAIIVVTRYFGGVLLGTGGLVRAYTDSASASVAALKDPQITSGKMLEVLEGRKITFASDYKDISKFESLTLKHEMCTVSKEYLENAVYSMIIEASRLDAFIKDAQNATRGAFSLMDDEAVTYCRDGVNAVLYEF